MVLVANRPCSFGGQKFYIGDKIPVNLVADARMQEKLGVVTVLNDNNGERLPDGQPGILYTQEQAGRMIAEAVDEAVNNTIMEMEQKQQELQQAAAGIQEFVTGAYSGTVQVPVGKELSGENGQLMVISATPEEIQQVFSIMQMNAEEGAKAVTGIKSDNVLVLLHAADSRKTIKNAAKEQAGRLSPADSYEISACSSLPEGAGTEGS